MKKIYLLLFVLCAIVTLHTHAQVPDTAIRAQTQVFNINEATEHWLNTLTPTQRAKSDAYFEGGYWLLLWNTLYAVLVGGIFLLTGLSRGIKNLVGKVNSANVQNLLYGVIYILLSWVL